MIALLRQAGGTSAVTRRRDHWNCNMRAISSAVVQSRLFENGCKKPNSDTVASLLDEVAEPTEFTSVVRALAYLKQKRVPPSLLANCRLRRQLASQERGFCAVFVGRSSHHRNKFGGFVEQSCYSLPILQFLTLSHLAVVNYAGTQINRESAGRCTVSTALPA